MVRDFTATDIFQVGGLTTSWAIKRDINSSNVFNASSSTPCDFSTSFLANTTTTMALEIRDDANHNNGRLPSRVKLSRDCSHTFGSRSATELVWRSWPGVGGACAMQGRAVRPLCQRLFADLTWLARNEAILIACLVPSSPRTSSPDSPSWNGKNGSRTDLHFTVSRMRKREASLAPSLAGAARSARSRGP